MIYHDSRDHYCAICGKTAEHVHHIIYRSKWPDGLRVDANRMPVCADCHQKLHERKVSVPDEHWTLANTAYGRWIEIFRSRESAHMDDLSPQELSSPPAQKKNPADLKEKVSERMKAYMRKAYERRKSHYDKWRREMAKKEKK